MKFPTIIFNFLIIKLLGEPIYKHQLRGLYEFEKTLYIDTTVNNIFNQLFTIIINDAKQNINSTYFDLYSQYFFALPLN